MQHQYASATNLSFLFFPNVLKCYLLEGLPSVPTALQTIPLNTSSMTEGPQDLKIHAIDTSFKMWPRKCSYITRNDTNWTQTSFCWSLHFVRVLWSRTNLISASHQSNSICIVLMTLKRYNTEIWFYVHVSSYRDDLPTVDIWYQFALSTLLGLQFV